ncbi:hypothetical protein M9Y10_000646 [Tritrichomonas musculus]|uniref:Guanylate cyclase domain-containing protein n=1 Tax=Tritrichomonas musculus TaxID=1915356 RepID=A0ABR2L4S7_9EUKA
MATPSSQVSIDTSNNGSVSQLSANSKNVFDEDSSAQQFQESFIFPLFSEMSRVVSIPSIICIIQIIIQIIQILTTNIYIYNIHIWKSISSVPKFYRYLSCIVNFGIIELASNNHTDKDIISQDDFYECWPLYIAVIIYLVINIVFNASILFFYRKKRVFLKWTLYTLSFFFSILNPIVLPPICGLAGFAIWQIDNHQSSSSIVYFVISFISAIILLTATIFSNYFSCHSIYISNSIDSCWDARVKNIFMFTNSLTSFLTFSLNPFSKPFFFTGLLICMLLNIYQLYLMFYLPFIKKHMNTLMQSISMLAISSIIVSFVHYFTTVNSIILIVIPIALFVIFFIVNFFLVSYRINKMLARMDVTDDDKQKKNDFIDFLNKGSDSLIVFSIQIGIEYLSPICYNYSIIKYILMINPSLKVLFPILQITAMIPAQTQFLSILLGNLTASRVSFTLIQNYIFYQARKVNVIRQSVSSKEELSEAKILHKMSEETISLVRGFWGEITHTKNVISTASLRYFKSSTNRTSSSYLDAFDQFPRSQKIYDQYVRFLIEATGDYKGSIQYTKKLMLIEKGNRVVHDYAFRSFANAFPKYLTERILDLHGMYIDKSIQNQSNESNMFSTNNLSSASTYDTTNSYHDDLIASTIFDHSKLRLTFQEIVKKSSMKSLDFNRILAIFTFLLACVLMLVLLFVIRDTSDNLNSLVKSITLTSKSLTSIQFAALLIGTKIYETIRFVDEQFLIDTILEELAIENTSLPDYPSIYNQPYVKLNQLIKNIRSYVNEEMTLIYSNPSFHAGEIFILNEWSPDIEHKAAYEWNWAFQRVDIPLSLRGIINMALTQIDRISASNYDEWDTVVFKLACYNGLLVNEGFDALFQNISQEGINHSDNYSNAFDVVAYALSILSVILFFIFPIVNFSCVMKEFKYLSSLLRGFNKEEIEASYKPIYLKHQHPLPTGTVHSAHDFSIEVFIIPFIIFLITVDCIFVVVYCCLTTEDFFEQYSHIFEWSNGAAQRASLILKVMAALHIDYTYDTWNPADLYTNESIGKLDLNLEEIKKFQALIDIEVIGIDSRIDDFYYKDHCSSLNESYDYAEIADCLSVSNQVHNAISLLKSMKKDFWDAFDVFNTFEYNALMYNIDKTVFDEFISFMDYFVTFSENITSEHFNSILVICIIGIIILFVLFIIENTLINMLYNSFEGFKQLIYTLPPVSMCQNTSLINFLAHKKSKNENQSISELVINNSQMGIITINESLTIQTINPVFTKMTGISSHKLLGQSIAFLVPVPSNEQGSISFERSAFYDAINEMRSNGSNTDSYSVKIKIRKDDLSVIHVNSNMIKIVDSSNSFKGVIIIMKDDEEKVELKKKLEQERLNTMNLIKVLIPNGALSSVKGKKQSVFYKADEASLMFIEIDGLTECISIMSPKTMMEILDQIYDGFEETLKKFNSISMIRWENNLLTAVSGLFDNVGDFKTLAFETASFLIELTRNLEEKNIQINTDFHLRLGAHIGGPVTGFIKDPTNPYFELRSPAFKYINAMKENAPLDQPQLTESIAKHLDLSIFDISNKSVIDCGDEKVNVYFAKFKEEYKVPVKNIMDVNSINSVNSDDLIENNMVSKVEENPQIDENVIDYQIQIDENQKVEDN